MHIQGSSIVG